jgi:hypothetical protein
MHSSSTLTTGDRSGVEVADDQAAALRRRVDTALADLLATRRTAHAADVPESDALVAAVERLAKGGGKRLRPALVEAAWRAAGGADAAAAEPGRGDAAGATALGLATEWKRTPSRITKRIWVPSSDVVQRSARSGTIFPSRS